MFCFELIQSEIAFNFSLQPGNWRSSPASSPLCCHQVPNCSGMTCFSFEKIGQPQISLLSETFTIYACEKEKKQTNTQNQNPKQTKPTNKTKIKTKTNKTNKTNKKPQENKTKLNIIYIIKLLMVYSGAFLTKENVLMKDLKIKRCNLVEVQIPQQHLVFQTRGQQEHSLLTGCSIQSMNFPYFDEDKHLHPSFSEHQEQDLSSSLLNTQHSLPSHARTQPGAVFPFLKLHTFLSSLNTVLCLKHKTWGQPLVWHRGEKCQRKKHGSHGPWPKQLHSFDVSSPSFSPINSMAALCTEPKKYSCTGAILVLFLGFSSCQCVQSIPVFHSLWSAGVRWTVS